MEYVIKAIQSTPVPIMLIFAGLFFLLLGFVTRLGGMIEVQPNQKRWTTPIGLLVLTIGLVLYFIPAPHLNTSNIDSELSPSSSPTSTKKPLDSEPSLLPSPASTSTPTQQSIALAPGEVWAMIEDPDGFTWVRSGPGTNYVMITRVVKGEIFYTIPQKQNDWWPVRTREGKHGYMHRSRIVIRNN